MLEALGAAGYGPEKVGALGTLLFVVILLIAARSYIRHTIARELRYHLMAMPMRDRRGRFVKVR